MKKIFLIALVLFLCLSNSSFAQFKKANFMIRGIKLPYQVSYPENYKPTKQYPLLVFLHGAGERGNDNELQLTHGKEFLLENTQKKFPAIVIVPQCPSDSYWSNVLKNDDGEKVNFVFGVEQNPTPAMEALQGLVNYWLQSGKIDTSRVYLGGLSMGGMGTYEMLERMPNTFAAAFAICGGGDPSQASLYARNTPTWIFYGEEDPVVDPKYSKEMYKALKKAGCKAKLTSYPNVGHNSWDNVFQEKNLFPWMFKYKD